MKGIKELKVSEKILESQVKELAKVLGWKYYHTWRSVHSQAGFPDCCLVKPPRIIFAELKTETGKVSDDQQDWLDTLAGCPWVEVYLWRPNELEDIAKILHEAVPKK